MTRNARRYLFTSAAALLAFAVALFFPLDRRLLVEILLLVLGALALQALVRAVTAYEPRREERSVAELARASRAVPAMPEALESLANRLILAEASAADFHRHVRPLLRGAAAGRLRARRVDLDRDPDAARALAGDELWELIRPDAQAPRDPRVRGVPPARIDAALDAIDRIRP